MGLSEPTTNVDVVLTTDQKGEIAELAIAHEAIKLGIDEDPLGFRV